MKISYCKVAGCSGDACSCYKNSYLLCVGLFHYNITFLGILSAAFKRPCDIMPLLILVERI